LISGWGYFPVIASEVKQSSVLRHSVQVRAGQLCHSGQARAELLRHSGLDPESINFDLDYHQH